MNKYDLKSKFILTSHQRKAVTSIVENVKNNMKFQTLLGVTGSGKTFTMANIIKELSVPALIIAHNKTLAAQLYNEMKLFFPNNNVEYFVSYYDYYQPEAYIPSSDTFIEKSTLINENIEQMRLSSTKSIIEGNNCIIIASVAAIYGIGSPKAYIDMILELKINMKLDRTKVFKKLVQMQYKRNDISFEKSNFRIKGESIDIYPPFYNSYPIRITTTFDDLIIKIATINHITGCTIDNFNRVFIYPASHYVTPKNTIDSMVSRIKNDLKARLIELNKNNKLLEAQRLEHRVNFDLEMLKETGYCNGIENYSFYLTNKAIGEPPYTLIDYFPKNSLLFIDESHVTLPQIKGMYFGDKSRKETLVNYGFRLPSTLENRPLKIQEFFKKTPVIVFVSATPGEVEKELSKEIFEQIIRPTGVLDPIIEVRSSTTQIDDLIYEIKKRALNDERVLVTALTKQLSEDLNNFFIENGIKSRYLHSSIDSIERIKVLKDFQIGNFDVIVGVNLLREGIDIPKISLVAILDADKEGFLRSEKSIIQTIGRAARNVNAKAILYANIITKSMKNAINETSRRRKIQIEYNKANNIIPKTIEKNNSINDKFFCFNETKNKKNNIDKKEIFSIDFTDPKNFKNINETIKRLRNKMNESADNLEFELAIELRSKIKELEKIKKNKYSI